MAEGGSWGDKRVGAHVVIDPCSLSHPYLGQDQSCSPCHLLIGENYTWLPSQLLLHSHEKWPSSHGDFGGKRVAGTPATPLPPSSSPLWRFPLSMASYVVSVILGRFRGSPLAIGNRAEYIRHPQGEVRRFALNQSWARVFKIMLRLAPVRLFQTVSGYRVFFNNKKIRFISLSRHRISCQ